MNALSAFFLYNIVYVYFFYGLAFFALGLVVLLETSRGSEFRFARALRPLAVFGLVHGWHEWLEMFQIFIANQTDSTATDFTTDLVATLTLVVSFLALLAFGLRLLPDAEERRAVTAYRVAAFGGVWLGGVLLVAWRLQPDLPDLTAAADVLARYCLGLPSALLAAWALLRERHDFHARGMSAYGRDLLWAALAFFIYGVVGQVFTRPSVLFPSQIVNTTLFLHTVGVPVQLVRGIAALAIVITLSSALRAFDLESRIRLAQANKQRLEAQAAALTAQAQRVSETEGLNAQLRHTAGELSALVEMARILSATVNLERLLADGLNRIVDSFEAASCSVIFLKRPDGGLELAGKYRRPDAPEPATLPALTLTVRDAIDNEQPAAAGLAGAVVLLDPQAWPAGRRYRTLAVPMHAKGQLFGALAMSALEDAEPFGSAELDLLIAFGQQLAASVENAWLYDELREREERLEQLVHQLVTAQEDERTRIARELHDETGQKLSALVMGLAAVENFLANDPLRALPAVREMRTMAQDSIDELRNIMANLRPSQLDDLGLAPAIRWYVQRYIERFPTIAVNLQLARPVERLQPQYETVLFRVLQEALTNVARHARATEVEIELAFELTCVRLRIADNGIGFDEATRERRREGGWGLVGIRERVALAGGRCVIDSRRGSGTRLMVELPLLNKMAETALSAPGRVN
ncbi:MAG TPA: GAF domain-containing sensor histidine kinase [Anaerolineae bacterium]